MAAEPDGGGDVVAAIDPTAKPLISDEVSELSPNSNSDENGASGTSNDQEIDRLEKLLTFSQEQLERLTRKDKDAKEKHSAKQREKAKTGGRCRGYKSEYEAKIMKLEKTIEDTKHAILLLKVHKKSSLDQSLKYNADEKARQEPDRSQNPEGIKEDLDRVSAKTQLANNQEQHNENSETKELKLQQRENSLAQRESAYGEEIRKFWEAQSEAERKEHENRKKYGKLERQFEELNKKLNDSERKRDEEAQSFQFQVDATVARALAATLRDHESVLRNVLDQHNRNLETEKRKAVTKALEEHEGAVQARIKETKAVADRERQQDLEKQKVVFQATMAKNKAAADEERQKALDQQHIALQAKIKGTKTAMDKERQQALEEQEATFQAKMEETKATADRERRQALKEQEAALRAEMEEAKAVADRARRLALEEQEVALQAKMKKAKATAKRKHQKGLVKEQLKIERSTLADDLVMLRNQELVFQAKVEDINASADKKRQEALDEQRRTHQTALAEALEERDQLHLKALAEAEAKANVASKSLAEQQARMKLDGAKPAAKCGHWVLTWLFAIAILTVVVGKISSAISCSFKGLDEIFTKTGEQLQEFSGPGLAQDAVSPLEIPEHDAYFSFTIDWPPGYPWDPKQDNSSSFAIDASEATHTPPPMALTTVQHLAPSATTPTPLPCSKFNPAYLPATNTQPVQYAMENCLPPIEHVIEGVREYATPLMRAMYNIAPYESDYLRHLPTLLVDYVSPLTRFQWFRRLNDLSKNVIAFYLGRDVSMYQYIEECHFITLVL